MAIELNSLDAFHRGLLPASAFAPPERALHVRLPRARDDQGEEDEKKALGDARPKPFNPYAGALKSARELEQNQKVVSPLESPATLPLLGGQVNLLV